MMILIRSPLLLVASASFIAWLHLFGVSRFVVESPTFFAGQGEREKAIASLAVLHSRNGVSADFKNWHFNEKVEKVSYSALFVAGWRTRVVTLGCCFICGTVNFAQYGLMYTLPALAENSNAKIFAVSAGTSVVTNCFAMVYGHRFPRRHLMLGALVVATVFVLPLARGYHNNVQLALLAVEFAAIGLAFFGVYLYIVEVSASALRASAAGLAMMCGRAAAAISPFVMESLGKLGFLVVMSSANVISAAIVYALQVEPNLRQLGDITSEPVALGAQKALASSDFN
jgi:hypothetical protein